MSFATERVESGRAACCPLGVCGTLLLALLAGCSGDGRLTVAGAVRLDGKPVKTGSIRFLHDEGKGPTAAGLIENGTYSVRAVPGDKRVEIEAYEVYAVWPTNPFVGAPPADLSRQIMPARYNVQSTLHVDVGNRSGAQDFDLTSDPPASK